MNSRITGKHILYTFIGLVLLITGAVVAKSARNLTGIIETIPYIFIGIGAGIFGHNLDAIVRILSLKNHSDAAKQLEIEQMDERNITIKNKAKAKAYDLMILVYGALMLAFGLMKADISMVLAMATAYLFIAGTSIYYSEKYRKEM